MKTQELPLPDLFEETKVCGVGRRPVKISSLRPGDWLELANGNECFTYLVLINSAKLRRIHFRSWDDMEFTFPYDMLTPNWRLLGTGRKREWWTLLPSWLKARINPYTYPK